VHTGSSGARIGKRLSWLLRHGALATGLPMDEAGWVPVAAVLEAVGTDRASLEAAVAADGKGRLEVCAAGDRVRACQGHSLPGTPVRVEALEASWTRVDRVEPLWHGTGLDALDPILREGLRPMDRTHVHLAGTRGDRVGKRDQVHVLLGVDPTRLAAAGLPVFRSANGVFLVREVPADCIVEVVPCTRRARRRLGGG
jgi:putative RNA 2'-phosphotransferase